MNLEALNGFLSDDHTIRKGHPCAVGTLLLKLQDNTPEAVPLLTQALDDLGIPASQVSSFLKSQGYEIASWTVRRHRNRHAKTDGCNCP